MPKHNLFSFFPGNGILNDAFENNGFRIAFINELRPEAMKDCAEGRVRQRRALPVYGSHDCPINDFLGSRKTELTNYVNSSRLDGSLVGFTGGVIDAEMFPDPETAGIRDEVSGFLAPFIVLVTRMVPDFFFLELKAQTRLFNDVCGMFEDGGYHLSYCFGPLLPAAPHKTCTYLFGVHSSVLEAKKWCRSILRDFPWNYGGEDTVAMADSLAKSLERFLSLKA